MKTTNQLWRFLASVQLAIFTFLALASTSIIGTIVPQNRALDFYIDSYGTFLGQVFLILDVDTMYNSWWFLSLLTLLALNITICSIDKFPQSRKKVTSKGGDFSNDKIRKMPFSYSLNCHNKDFDALNFLATNGWQATKHGRAEGNVFYASKQAWSHYGVYLVHVSILVIFAGAIVGSIAGYKGSVMIPELGSADKIYSQLTSKPLPLPFEVRCDSFTIEYYDTGMPKTYRSKLTILENGAETLTQNIEVNRPLIYQGVTFYQASYEGFQTFIVHIKDNITGEEKTLKADFQKQNQWTDKGVQIGILNAMATDQHVDRAKLWFYDENHEPTTLWFDNNVPQKIEGTPYTVSVKQMYATGLQVARDPGVPLVYLGCAMMMIGLYICFFLSHRKVWLIQQGDTVTLAATTNKNKVGFEKTFTALKEQLTKQLS